MEQRPSDERPPAESPVEPPAPPRDQAQQATGRMAITSLVLGIVSLVLWCFPLVGVPAAIIGLVLGVLDRHSERRNIALAGIVLCSIALVLAVITVIVAVFTITTQPAPGP